MTGAIITVVDPGGPGSQAGLRPGDILEKINGEPQSNSRAFMRDIVMMKLHSPAHLTIWRNGKLKDLDTAIAEWPNYMPDGGMVSGRMAEAMIASAPDPGVRLAPITDADRKRYGIAPTVTGVLIASVEKDCEASDLGIVPGNVIIAAQGQPVASRLTCGRP